MSLIKGHLENPLRIKSSMLPCRWMFRFFLLSLTVKIWRGDLSPWRSPPGRWMDASCLAAVAPGKQVLPHGEPAQNQVDTQGWAPRHCQHGQASPAWTKEMDLALVVIDMCLQLVSGNRRLSCGLVSNQGKFISWLWTFPQSKHIRVLQDTETIQCHSILFQCYSKP